MDFIILVVKLVFMDMIDKCLLVEMCCDVFDWMVKMIFKMVSLFGGFGNLVKLIW